MLRVVWPVIVTFFVWIHRFADVFVPQSVILNLFSQHQWQLVNMYHTTSIVPGSREPVLSDMIIFSKSVKLG